ncbi:MAG: hypothetical protein KatS3mg027_1645 [Bacteroidia bacterium]|nr:MAG: hypothetical protein KatS3mg027_1645 [Bacteroidia bacterium]
MKLDNARNYLENAKSLLKEKAIKKNGHYQYKKYVRLAGHAAYLGVLEALDELMKHSNYSVKGRKDIVKYQEFLAHYNKKMLQELNDAYEILHLYMGYDGGLKYIFCQEGIKTAERIIEWVEKQLEKSK